jgi:hypothetical protein
MVVLGTPPPPRVFSQRDTFILTIQIIVIPDSVYFLRPKGVTSSCLCVSVLQFAS